MGKIVQKIELLTTRPTTTSSTYQPGDATLGAWKFDKDLFDPITAIYFEAVTSITYTGLPEGAATCTAHLYNMTQGAEVPGSVVTNTTFGGVEFKRVRSGNLVSQINDGDVLYPEFKGNEAQIRAAKILIYQKGYIRKTATYVQVGDNKTYSLSPNLKQEVNNRKRWAHTASDYDGTVTYNFACTMRSFNGGDNAYCYLQDETAASTLATISTTSSTAGWVEGVPTTPTDGNELSVRQATDNPVNNGCVIYNGFFIVQQSAQGGITKLRTPIQVWQSLVTTTATTYPGNVFEEADYDPDDYQNCTVDTVHEASLKISNAAGTAYSQLLDDGSAFASTEVTTSATAFTRVVSASLTEPTTKSDIDFDFKSSDAAYTTSLCSNRLNVTITSLKPKARLLASEGAGT